MRSHMPTTVTYCTSSGKAKHENRLTYAAVVRQRLDRYFCLTLADLMCAKCATV